MAIYARPNNESNIYGLILQNKVNIHYYSNLPYETHPLLHYLMEM